MKLLLVTLVTCLALQFTCSQAGPVSQASLVSNGAMDGDRGSLCPKGFEAISQNLDGAGKIWSQPHPLATRTKDECAAICMARSGCTSFEFAEGESYHGACGTYTGGHANVQGDENRLSANSNWRSCLLKPNISVRHAGIDQLLMEGVLTNTTVAEGNPFNLGCEVRTKRQMDLKWLKKVDKNYRDEHASFLHLQTGRYMVLSPSSSTRHAITDGYRIGGGSYPHTLGVLSAAPEDSGEYMCAIFLPDRGLQTNHHQLHETILANQSATVTVIPKHSMFKWGFRYLRLMLTF